MAKRAMEEGRTKIPYVIDNETRSCATFFATMLGPVQSLTLAHGVFV